MIQKIETQELIRACTKCNTVFRVLVDPVGYRAWMNDGELIQNALPTLSLGHRELLISGTCEECFNKMFGPE